MSENTDILVVGGGLVGQIAAISLARLGHDVVHLAPDAPEDRRTSALMQPAIAFLKKHGLLENPAAIGHELARIRIIDATDRLLRAPETLFDAKEGGGDAFGWNLPNAALLAHLKTIAAGTAHLRAYTDALAGLQVFDTHVEAVTASGRLLIAALVVGADGKRSLVRTASGFRSRETAYKQSALVCDLELERGLGETSVEFHYPNGPFTLVPAGGARANLVYIDAPEPLAEIRALPPEMQAERFAACAHNLFGRMKVLTPTAVFPLSSLAVPEAGKDGVVLVGEAAHAFPPIGAQGLNLGLRDVADLADFVSMADTTQPGWGRKLSERFAARRSGDLARTGLVVDGLFRSLLSAQLPAQMVRSGGLWALRSIPALRKQAFSLGMGQR
jgi:2-octaprenyl-6-methoxyphenol hydroxylase